MYMDSKGAVRIIMPNGTFNLPNVTRVVVGKILDPNKDFPKFYFRSIRIETEEGAIEMLLEASSDRPLRMDNEGSVFQTLKKQVAG